jgi:hypothetical protein
VCPGEHEVYNEEGFQCKVGAWVEKLMHIESQLQSC